MTPLVFDFLRRSGIVADIGPQTRLSAIKMRNSALPGGALVSLLFVDNLPVPRYLLRIPRDPIHIERLVNNYTALQCLQEIESLQGTVPAPVYMGEIEGVLVTLETFLDGASLALEMAVAMRLGEQTRFTSLEECATGWLWRLHDATFTEQTDSHKLVADFLSARTADIETIRQSECLTLSELEHLQSSLRHLHLESLPFARCHGDYNPNNLLLLPANPGLGMIAGLGVVDWEYSAPGCALFDLFQLITIAYLHPATDVTMRRECLHDLWHPSTPIGAVFAASVERYIDQNRLAAEDVRPLFSLYLAHMAADHLRIYHDRSEPMSGFWRELITAESESGSF